MIIMIIISVTPCMGHERNMPWHTLDNAVITVHNTKAAVLLKTEVDMSDGLLVPARAVESLFLSFSLGKGKVPLSGHEPRPKSKEAN